MSLSQKSDRVITLISYKFICRLNVQYKSSVVYTKMPLRFDNSFYE